MNKQDDKNITESTEEQNTFFAMKAGNKPYISDQRMEANRWQLKRNLNSISSKQDFFMTRFFAVIASNKTQLASMSLTFFLGYMFASTSLLNSHKEKSLQNQLVESKKPSNTILADNEQIIDLKLSRNKNNQFNVSYTTLNHSNLQADISNDETVSILTTALKNNLDDATRLELVEILKDHLENSKIRKSLSNALLNDPNPGVRMVAAESLSQFSNSQQVRTTLRQALSNDINQGVRVSVFEGLIQHLDDDKTIKLFETKVLGDSNYYIRNETKNILERIQQKKQSQINTI